MAEIEAAQRAVGAGTLVMAPDRRRRAGPRALLTEHVARSLAPAWTSDFVQNPPAGFLHNRWSE